ncbi:Inner membrane protein translocase and chaperone YidC, short form OxaI-like [Candidatus Syntrophocurvum alkaliphilum]|uniref:Inner membrane protein translocase and chaperone YidC, short form OxaI-like n=1 Tax=Candidatus Syntrophocurvum alkaliphilum TaxID=2293317 RepID=A0A6I6DDN7_9FIRM|nr:Inner membrane protein translocase and chaperone YidC, short form OxaI-like [Candidatus Syntrophocurvum alkaliphilum]
MQWFTDVIHFFYSITESIGVPSYGLAIILITIVIKIILFPLTQKQMKSMRAMQALQPKMKYLQEKYKDDPQTMQTKVMQLYKDNGVNPFGGCLPLLIQLPIFIAFFQALMDFPFLEGAPTGFLWIPDIAQPDSLFILAILAAVTTYAMQRVSMVNTNDPTQRILLYIMPLFMAFIAATMPAGLPLYWITFNLLSIAQQLYVNKLLDNATTVAADTGTGVQIDVDIEEEEVNEEEINEEEETKENTNKNNTNTTNTKKKKKKGKNKEGKRRKG